MNDWRRIRGFGLAAALASLVLFAVIHLQSKAGGIVIEVYAVDSLFILDVLNRIRDGGVAHVDFTLHLGALPFELGSMGNGAISANFMAAQWSLATALLLVGLWVGMTRLTPLATTFLLISTVFVATALSTTFDPRITLGLFYNRWAWAIAIVFCVALFVRPKAAAPTLIDAALIGTLSMALLATKITYFVALVPLGVLIYARAARWAEIGIAAAACLAIAALAAFAFGLSFWSSYVENLVWVANNPIRRQPGNGVIVLLTDPGRLGYAVTFLLFGLALYWRNGQRVLFLWLLGGLAFLFIQTQNFGNTALWIVPLGAIALSLASHAPSHEPNRVRNLFRLVAFSAVVLSLPTLNILAQSNLRNASAFSGEATALMPGVAAFDGLMIQSQQVAPIVEVPLENGPDAPPHMGQCFAKEGFLGVFREVAAVLDTLDGAVFVADAQSPYWMQNGQPPLEGAAPWNYGSLRGLEKADYVAVPNCPFKPSYQREILKTFVEQDIELTPVQTTERVTIMTWRRE